MKISFLILIKRQQKHFVLGGGSAHGFRHTPALGKLVTDALSGKKKIPSLFRLNSNRY